jgi:hypothetical protein
VRISLTSGETTYHLAGQSGVSERVHSSAGDLSVSAQINTQPRDGVRRAAAGLHDRKNLKTTISFTTTRLFATQALAQAFSLDYDGAYPRTGTLTLTPIGGTAKYLREAVVFPPDRRVIGATVQLSYTVTGSGIFASAS